MHFTLEMSGLAQWLAAIRTAIRKLWRQFCSRLAIHSLLLGHLEQRGVNGDAPGVPEGPQKALNTSSPTTQTMTFFYAT